MKDPAKPFRVKIVGRLNRSRSPWETMKRYFPPVSCTERKPKQPRPFGGSKSTDTYPQPRPSGNGKLPKSGKYTLLYNTSQLMSMAVWIEVGMALHYESCGSNEGLILWDQWSRKSDKYDGYGVCARRWTTFGKVVTA